MKDFSLLIRKAPAYAVLLAFVLIMNISEKIHAATYYISSSSGNNSASGTSPETAWKTLDKLYSEWDIIGPGDRILLRRGDTFAPSEIKKLGVLEIPNRKSGSEEAYIVIGAYGSGEKPVISNGNVSSYSKAIYTRAISYFAFEDLRIIGGALFRVDEDPEGVHHIRLSRLEFEGEGAAFFNVYQPANTPEPNTGNPCHHIELEYSLFTDTQGQDAFNVTATQGYNHFHHNRFINVNEEAIDIGGGDNSVIEYNYISGTTANGIKAHSQFIKQRGVVIRGNNIIIGKDNYNYALALENVSDAKVYNNTLVGFYSAFLGWQHANPPLVTESDPAKDMSGNYFINNVFYGVVIIGQAKDVRYSYRNGSSAVIKHDDIWDDNHFIRNQFYSDQDSKKIRIFNFRGKINYDASTAPYGRYYSELKKDEINISEKHFYKLWSKNKNVSDDVYGDPSFVRQEWYSAEDPGDYHLSDDSDARENGMNIPEYIYDIENNLIPEGVKPDKGAYQSSGKPSTGDIKRPGIKAVLADEPSTIMVMFSEPMDLASAADIFNYTISNGVKIKSIVADDNARLFALNTTPHIPGERYQITVINVRDLAGNIIDPALGSYTYSFGDIANDGMIEENNPRDEKPETGGAAVSEELTLEQNYPNPFNSSTNIVFTLPKEQPVSIVLYNVTGEEVNRVYGGIKKAGSHSMLLDFSGLASGIYFCRISTPDRTLIKKMFLMK